MIRVLIRAGRRYWLGNAGDSASMSALSEERLPSLIAPCGPKNELTPRRLPAPPSARSHALGFGRNGGCSCARCNRHRSATARSVCAVAMHPTRDFVPSRHIWRVAWCTGSQRAQKTRCPSVILTPRAGRRAHRIPPGRSPSPRGVRARESEMPARTECGCHRRRAAVASP